ncbi:hypothetical protein [Thermus sp.]|uniref:hypothetical protein n=1 Tax=Thermus sp. TaxID=275 RepID=UPI0025F59B79|nr:hypothetical protein [Thermus sp.]MCS6867133.1 hypothetical protein [Thermus sp.]
MQVSIKQFTYPGLVSEGWCDVDVLSRPEEVLVVLRDQGDHPSTSVTNVIEEVKVQVAQRILAPSGLVGLPTTWVAWSRVDGILSLVRFREPGYWSPEWRFMSPQGFRALLRQFGQAGLLEEWLREGSIWLKEIGGADELPPPRPA